MSTADRYTDADVEAVAQVVGGAQEERHGPHLIAHAVLDALTAAGWAPRAQVAEDIATNPGPDPSPASPMWWAGWLEGRDDAAAIARDHTTTGGHHD